MYIYILECVFVCMYTYTFPYMHIRVHIHPYTYVSIPVYMYISQEEEGIWLLQFTIKLDHTIINNWRKNIIIQFTCCAYVF